MIPQSAIDLILESEGLDQPAAWPGGDSGITIGIGYDLGYADPHNFVQDWQRYLGPGQIGRLLTAIGKRGAAAKAIAHTFDDISIARHDAETVFILRTIPDEEAKTARAFPGCELLPDAARGALVSLIYNRGPEMADAKDDPDHNRREEMRAIHSAIARFAALPEDEHEFELAYYLEEIAAQIRTMKRLWVGKGLDGLIKRREAEAKLVESAIPVERATAA